MCAMSPSTVIAGSSTSATSPATTSDMLWGGILVAMPTAMPCVPLTSSRGILAGRTVGSSWLASKVGDQSTWGGGGRRVSFAVG